jgi:hypothetical protein
MDEPGKVVLTVYSRVLGISVEQSELQNPSNVPSTWIEAGSSHNTTAAEATAHGS